jgi:5-formyltetrahydrofolate cyclo-ligase
MISKQTLRETWRNWRATIPSDERERAANRAAAHLNLDSHFQASQHIACYFSFKDEFPSWPIINCIWEANKICYLPVIQEGSATLLFTTYQKNDELLINRYGILEPINPAVLPPNNLDMIIMPLLAIDLTGHRLGSGGGYYDRTLANINQHTKKPLLMGLGYAAQIIGQVPHDPWDVRLDGVVTENKVFYIE